MRSHAALLSAVITLAFGAGLSAHEPNINAPHVRGLNQAATTAVAAAQQRSATVRDLIGALEASNLVAYVNVTALPQGAEASDLRFLTSSAQQRFVVITISNGVATDRQIELLGHELQHAADVAKTTWVNSDSQFQSLMRLGGWHDATRARGYETTTATIAEHHVREELRRASGKR